MGRSFAGLAATAAAANFLANGERALVVAQRPAAWRERSAGRELLSDD